MYSGFNLFIKKAKMKQKELIIQEEELLLYKDIYRESGIRFLGYTHEIARALGNLLQFPSGMLHFSYGLTATYICADIMEKSLNENQKENVTALNVAETAERTLIWQIFASIIFPRLFIDKITRAAIRMARTDLKFPVDSRLMGGLLGLALIPILVSPIDDLVNIMGLNPNNPPKKLKMKEDREYDVYRDSLLRYLGYSNEVGEAFRPLIPGYIVKLTYGVAMGYVLSDTIDKSAKVYNKPGSTMTDVAKKAGDILIWQTFASVAIPGFTINRITKVSRMLLKSVPNSKYIPTAIGLVSIPLIIKPIDHLVDYVMDNTYRKYFNVH